MSKPLAGKVVLVTGGSRGIGAAVVRRLASDGASVAFTYAASQDQAQALAKGVIDAGGDALPIKAAPTQPRSRTRSLGRQIGSAASIFS